MRRILLTYFVLLVTAHSLLAQRYNLLPDTIRLCENDSASIELRAEVGAGTTIRWRTPRGVTEDVKKIKAKTRGKYYIELLRQGAVTMVDSSYVRFVPRPRAVLRDTGICRGRSVTLDAKNPGMRYLWNTGQTSQKIIAENAGRYWVRISNGKCVLTDTVNVRFLAGSSPALSREAVFCLNEENKVLSVKAGTDVAVMWSTGSTSPSISIVSEGIYWVSTRNEICGEHTDTINVRLKACECEMMIPNSFSPNEDNRNDHFFPVLSCDYSYFMLSITDRWGNTVFTTYSTNGRWDGRFKGNLCPEDVYIYRIESTEKGQDKKRVRTGHISLFR